MIASLRLAHFRPYEERTFTFEPGLNLICGPNAVGKTTVLEALYLLISGRSFRAQQLPECIRQGAESFFLEAAFLRHGISQRLSFALSPHEKRLMYNQTACPSLTALLGVLQGTILIPDDNQLLKGAPQGRRRYLDIQLAQIDPLYVHHLSRYTRALTQRNALLKSKSALAIEAWEAMLAVSGDYVMVERHKAVVELEIQVKALYQQLGGESETISLLYKPSMTASTYRDQLAKTRKRELDLGFTLQGPHRDELEICLNGKPARFFASEGQQRTLISSLRMAEWRRLATHTGAQPLFLIDEVGLGLDSRRRELLFQQIAQMGQVIMTATEPLTSLPLHTIPL